MASVASEPFGMSYMQEFKSAVKPLSFYARVTALATHLLLIAGLILWSGNALGLLVAAPLLAPLWGLIKGREYTYAWASLMITFYCAALLAEGFARPQHHLHGYLLASVAALEFAGLTLYVR